VQKKRIHFRAKVGDTRAAAIFSRAIVVPVGSPLCWRSRFYCSDIYESGQLR
jgi:hypothetical protein